MHMNRLLYMTPRSFLHTTLLDPTCRILCKATLQDIRLLGCICFRQICTMYSLMHANTFCFLLNLLWTMDMNLTQYKCQVIYCFHLNLHNSMNRLLPSLVFQTNLSMYTVFRLKDRTAFLQTSASSILPPL